MRGSENGPPSAAALRKFWVVAEAAERAIAPRKGGAQSNELDGNTCGRHAMRVRDACQLFRTIYMPIHLHAVVEGSRAQGLTATHDRAEHGIWAFRAPRR